MDQHEEFLYTDVPLAIDKLDRDQIPKFGKMSPQHMLEHLGGIFLISSGKVKIKAPSAEQTQSYYDWFMSEDFGFKPNTKSPILSEDLPVLRFASIDAAKEAVLKSIQRFKVNFEQNPSSTTIHPVFGTLNYQEWLRFHQEHSRHHLDQFNIL